MKALLELAIDAKPEEIVDALKKQILVILDVKDLIALYARGLLRKEDIIKLILSGYLPLNALKDLDELQEVLSKEEIERIKDELKRLLERVFGR